MIRNETRNKNQRKITKLPQNKLAIDESFSRVFSFTNYYYYYNYLEDLGIKKECCVYTEMIQIKE